MTGRPLEVTEVGFADAVAAAAVLVMGEAAEAGPLLWYAARHGMPRRGRPPRWCDLGRGLCSDERRRPASYVALSGGIGGAKLSLGLVHLLGDRLTVIVNTGDDFEHLGLAISPDIDTTLYTLGAVVNPETGWGRRDETWSFMQALAALGGPAWFSLGDRDLATHVDRTHPPQVWRDSDRCHGPSGGEVGCRRARSTHDG